MKIKILLLLLLPFLAMAQEKPVQKKYTFQSHQENTTPRDADLGWYTQPYKKADDLWYFKKEGVETLLFATRGGSFLGDVSTAAEFQGLAPLDSLDFTYISEDILVGNPPLQIQYAKGYWKWNGTSWFPYDLDTSIGISKDLGNSLTYGLDGGIFLGAADPCFEYDFPNETVGQPSSGTEVTTGNWTIHTDNTSIRPTLDAANVAHVNLTNLGEHENKEVTFDLQASGRVQFNMNQVGSPVDGFGRANERIEIGLLGGTDVRYRSYAGVFTQVTATGFSFNDNVKRSFRYRVSRDGINITTTFEVDNAGDWQEVFNEQALESDYPNDFYVSITGGAGVNNNNVFVSNVKGGDCSQSNEIDLLDSLRINSSKDSLFYTRTNGKIDTVSLIKNCAYNVAQVTAGDVDEIASWDANQRFVKSQFYVSLDPNSNTPITELEVTNGQTVTAYILAQQYFINTSSFGAAPIGIKVEITNTNEVLTGVVLERYYSNSGNYANLTYNQLALGSFPPTTGTELSTTQLNNWLTGGGDCEEVSQQWYDECYTNGSPNTNTAIAGNMQAAAGAVAPVTRPFGITNNTTDPILVTAVRIRYGANGYTGTGSFTMLGEQFSQVAPQFDQVGAGPFYATVEFLPDNGVGVVFQPNDTHNSGSSTNHGATIGPFQGPISGGANGIISGLATCEVDYVEGETLGGDYILRTYQDGSLATVDKSMNGYTTSISATDTIGWNLCEQVSQAEVDLNTAKVSDINHVQLELPNVDNTSDIDKPVSTAQQLEIDTKVDKVTSTDNAITRFDGTTGEIQNSTATIDDAGDMIVDGKVKSTDLQIETAAPSATEDLWQATDNVGNGKWFNPFQSNEIITKEVEESTTNTEAIYQSVTRILIAGTYSITSHVKHRDNTTFNDYIGRLYIDGVLSDEFVMEFAETGTDQIMPTTLHSSLVVPSDASVTIEYRYLSNSSFATSFTLKNEIVIQRIK